MVRPSLLSALPLFMLAELALGKNCETHSFTTCEDKIVHWYDPETGEICDPLDCGGGRAPPKTNVPGCAGYTGTEVRKVSYLSCFKASTTEEPSSVEATTEAEATETATDSEDESSTESIAKSTTENDAEPAETESSPSTTTAPGSTTQETAAATTSAASLSTETEASDDATTTPTSTPNAARILDGSLMAVAGAVIGVMALV
ncbi:hypothetical protein FDECE_10861 [Fusarium decemcellulare]|nr:hypothetical protein FDECE_10861 [Fusarium decemcellulare]